jgi:hypothetical protein
MTEATARQDYDQFVVQLSALHSPTLHPLDRDAQLENGGVLAVGMLAGSGMPGSAACLAYLLESRFPGQNWPWNR